VNQPFIVGFSEITILNVCSHRKQSFRRQNQHDGEGRESATSGRAVLKLATTYEGHERSVIAES